MDVEQRLAKLERSVKRWKFAAVCLLVVGLCGAGYNATVPDEIRARAFVVEGYNGEPVGVFGYLKKDGQCVFGISTNDLKSNTFIYPGSKKISITDSKGVDSFIE